MKVDNLLDQAIKVIQDFPHKRNNLFLTNPKLTTVINHILDYHEKDINSKGNVSSMIIKELNKLDNEEIFQVAEVIASINGRKIVEHFDLYNITNKNKSFKLACLSAYCHPHATSYFFKNYKIEHYPTRFVIAKISSFGDGYNTLKYLDNYGLSDQDRLEIFKQALIMDQECLTLLPELLRDRKLTQLRRDAPLSEVLEWLDKNKNELSSILPLYTSKLIYSDMQRRNACIKLISGCIGNVKLNPNKNGSRNAVKRITGFPVEILEGSTYSSNSLGDFYESILELQSKFLYPCFKNVRFIEDPKNKVSLKSISEIVNKLNMCSHLIGIGADARIKEIFTYFNEDHAKYTKGRVTINISRFKEISSYLEFVFLEMIKKIQGSSIYLTKDSIDALATSPESYNPILVLIARCYGNPRWENVLPTLTKITKAILEDKFLSLKYTGDTTRKEDLDLVKKQIGFLTVSQMRIWRSNPYKLKMVEINQTDLTNLTTSELLKHFKSLLTSSIPNDVKEIMAAIPLKIIDVNLLSTNEKEIMNVLKNLYLLDYRNKIAYCLCIVMKAKSIDSFNKGLSKIKSLKDILKPNLSLIQSINLIQNNIRTIKKKDLRIIFTSIIDDPILMLSFGNLVPTSSCYNYKSGSQAQTVVAETIDAHTKGLISLIINPHEYLHKNQVELLSKQIANKKVKCELDAKKKHLYFYTDKKLIFRASFNFVYYRRYLRIGITRGHHIGIRLEPPATQKHSLIESIAIQSELLFNEFITKIGATDKEPTYISDSRSPGGSYSDVAGGPQKDGFYMESNLKIEP